MTTSVRRFLSAVALSSVLISTSVPAWAAATERRGTPRSETPRAAPRTPTARSPQASTAPRTAVRRTEPRQTAAGQSRYGHGPHGGSRWYPAAGWYGYPWWSFDAYWGWGWPSWGPWLYGTPRYGYEVPSAVYADRGPARLELDVTPRRATVQLDGEAVGRVKDWDGRWDRLPAEPGDRVLTFEAPGYKTLRVRVDARSGGLYRVSYDLAKGEGLDSRSASAEAKTSVVPEALDRESPPLGDAARGGLARGFVRVNVTPGDAAVYLDGSYFARADELTRLRGALPLAVGTHTIEVVRPGYESRKIEVEVVAERPVEVELELRRTR